MNAYRIRTNDAREGEYLVIANDPTAACEIVNQFYSERSYDPDVIVIEVVGTCWPSPQGYTRSPSGRARPEGPRMTKHAFARAVRHNQWHRLALQFDLHRIQALSLLRATLDDTASTPEIRKFLATPPGIATHQHVKRGSQYIFLGFGKMQAENWRDHDDYSDSNGEFPSVDMREVAIYRSVDDHTLWVRPREEWEDGRFIEFPNLGDER